MATTLDQPDGRNFQYGLFCMIALGSLLAAGCQDSATDVSQPKRTEEQKPSDADVINQRAEQAARRLGEKHKANVDWCRPFLAGSEKGSDSLRWIFIDRQLFSIDLERALLDQHGIVFVADLIDVRARGNDVLVEFAFPEIWSNTIIFVLQATDQQIRPLLSKRPTFESRYVVVAKISDLNRPSLRLTSEINTDQLNDDILNDPEYGSEQGVTIDEDSIDMSVEVTGADLPFYATGELIECDHILIDKE